MSLLVFEVKHFCPQQEGTLMGSAFGVCFTYWFGTSGLLLFLAYVCNTHITALQILSLMVRLLHLIWNNCVSAVYILLRNGEFFL